MVPSAAVSSVAGVMVLANVWELPPNVLAPVLVANAPVLPAKLFDALPLAVNPVPITAAVKVLLVNVSVPARVASVPVVGSVTVVAAEAVRVTE